MIWFVWMSDISQIASRVGGRGGDWERGSKLPISLHYLVQGEGTAGGLRSLPLALPSSPAKMGKTPIRTDHPAFGKSGKILGFLPLLL